MSKVEQLQTTVEQIGDDILSRMYGGRSGSNMDLMNLLLKAVRAEAEERVWGLVERVLGHEDHGWVEGLREEWDGGWVVCCAAFRYMDLAKPTAREAILAAAKELGIQTEEVRS